MLAEKAPRAEFTLLFSREDLMTLAAVGLRIAEAARDWMWSKATAALEGAKGGMGLLTKPEAGEEG